MLTKAPSIVSVNLDVILKTSQIVIAATAEFPTLGWSELQLSPYYYIVPPEDGIYDFDLLAKQPNSDVGQQVETLTTTTSRSIEGVRGVRIHAAKNKLVVRLATITSETPPKGDEFKVSQAVIEADQLKIDVTYSGGCERHNFDLYWDGSYQESFPQQVQMVLVHDANSDPCERSIQETLIFDLLDLEPAVIKLSNEFGDTTSLNYKIRSEQKFTLISS